MPLYLCHWENGDFSVVQAGNKTIAIEMLDEVANAECMPLYAISDFMVHFRLTDEGRVELEGFGEEFGDQVRERVHPILGALDASPYEADPGDRDRIRDPVEQERSRLKAAAAPVPATELGWYIKEQTDLPTSVVDRHVRNAARDVLKNSKLKGKPN